jgi:uncharacterized membrane protein YphA (DoxX/SURF4 family)/peroxiredoxin
MGPALVVLRAAIAVILAVAGISKLADRPGSRQALIDFGVPMQMAGLLATGLALTELGIGILLLPSGTARGAAVAAGVLFLLFAAVVAYQLARGRHPQCNCFGQLHSEPIGAGTLLRNTVLVGLAVVIAVMPAPNWSALIAALGGASPIWAGTMVLLLSLVFAEGWLLLNLARQQGRLLLRLDAMESRLDGQPSETRTLASKPIGRAIGSIAPTFQLPSLYGPDVSLADLMAAGRPVLLLSIDPGCGPCTALLPDVAAWQTSAAPLTVAVLSRGSTEANERKLQPLGIRNVLLQKKQEVAEQYHTIATPSAVLVDPDGRVASSVAAGPEAIRRLVERTQHTGRQAGGLPLGSPAPAIGLPGLDGVPFDFQERGGQSTVLLFWNPGCGFCGRMLPDLASWEAGRPADTGLVLVSEGSIEENREMGLRSQILFADDFAVGRSYGATGTPSAVFIDGSGSVASSVAVGAAGVFALLERLERGQEVTGSVSHSIS